MKSIFLMISFGFFLISTELYAQKIYQDKEGKIIMEYPSPSYSATGESQSDDPVIRIEIATLDLGTKGFGTGEMTMNWMVADSLCKRMCDQEEGWRMPTQQELLHIWLSQNKLNVIFDQINSNRQPTAMLFESDSYWSSTEICSLSARAVDFCTGERGSYKSNKNRVRCVREIP